MRVPMAFGWSLHQRIITVALIVCFVAIVATAGMIDTRHSDIVRRKAMRDTESLMSEFDLLMRTPNAANFARVVKDGDRTLLVSVAPQLEDLFIQKGAAAITLNDNVLWQSDQDQELVRLLLLSIEPSMQERSEVIRSNPSGRQEAYVISKRYPRKIPKPGAQGNGNRVLEGFPVTYHVALAMNPYRREIQSFRHSLAAMIVMAMVVLGAAMFFTIRWQLRSLERLRQSVSELKGSSGERVEKRDSDPREIRAVADRFNQFLREQDKVREEEKLVYKTLDDRLKGMREVMDNNTVGSGLFSHGLKSMLDSILLTEFKAIPEAEQKEIRDRLREINKEIQTKLDEFIQTEAKESPPLIDIVSVAQRLFTKNEHTKKSPLLNHIRNHLPDKCFTDNSFELVHEEVHLHTRIFEDILHELMMNLLRNAGKAAEKRVRMIITKKDEMIQIVVEDDGPGFPSTGRRNLLIRGKATEATYGKYEGHGIGLPYSRRVACSHYGDLLLEDSDELGGARVILELPLLDDNSAVNVAGNHSTSEDASVEEATDRLTGG